MLVLHFSAKDRSCIARLLLHKRKGLLIEIKRFFNRFGLCQLLFVVGIIKVIVAAIGMVGR